MKLCIPTYCNYEGLKALLLSAELGSEKPSSYFIIDNGKSVASVGELQALVSAPVVLWSPRENLGVAASWNRFLAMYEDEPIVISNDDIVLGKDAFAMLTREADAGTPICGFGWALFMQSPECTKRVGYYDENFWPAYYEDIDYIRRMQLAGVPEKRLEGKIDIEHRGWQTTTLLGNPAWLSDGREKNHSYFIAKWGAELEGDTFREPFNGEAPLGWDARAPKRWGALPLLHEVIGASGQELGAKRYLILGGEDSYAHRITLPEGRRIAGNNEIDQFLSTTTERFDIVVIDGEHTWPRVMREHELSLKVLTERGIIVMHDTSPHSEEMQRVPYAGSHAWTGNAWRAVVELRKFHTRNTAVCTLNTHYGITIVVPHAKAWLDSPIDCGAIKDISYAELALNRREYLGLLQGWDDWRRWVRETALGAREAHEPKLEAPLPKEHTRAPADEPVTRPALKLNLGCSTEHKPGYLNVDRVEPADFLADLTGRWPWADSSVDEIRAFDVVEHLPDKLHTMNEAFRVLKPGGVFHLFVPTTDGRGAFQDPTHVSYWNAHSLWYYESGNAHRERFGDAYGVKARFRIERQALTRDSSGTIEHLEAVLLCDKPEGPVPSASSKSSSFLSPQQSTASFVSLPRGTATSFSSAPPEQGELVVIFDQRFRPDTTGAHLLRALEALPLGVGPVIRYVQPPCDVHGGERVVRTSEPYRAKDFECAQAILVIDDDIDWRLPTPPPGVPMYYWCIDSYRMDEKLWLGGTRRGRISDGRFTRVFYSQVLDAARAPDIGAGLLPVAVDLETYYYAPPLDLVYDWCFVGKMSPERTSLCEALKRQPFKGYAGPADAASANLIYNQSAIAVNLSAGEVNMRVFEAQATGALLITNRFTRGGEHHFHSLCYYDSPNDLIEQMKWWLAHPDDRKKRAYRQAEEMREHTYRARALHLLDMTVFAGETYREEHHATGESRP